MNLTPHLPSQLGKKTSYTDNIVIGASDHEYTYLIKQVLLEDTKNKFNHLFVTTSPSDAEELYATFNDQKNLHSRYNAHLFISTGHSPYQRLAGSLEECHKLYDALIRLTHSNKENIIITDQLFMKTYLPPKEYFKDKTQTISVSDVLDEADLKQLFLELGLVKVPAISMPGEFSRKGEILDLWPLGHSPVRLYFFDELIENIKEIDPVTLRAIPEKTIDQITVFPSPLALCKTHGQNLKQKLPQFGPDQRQKFNQRKAIIEQINSSMEFEYMHLWLPHFFETPTTILSYFNSDTTIVHFLNHTNSKLHIKDLYQDYEEEYFDIEQDSNNDIIVPKVDYIFNKKNLSKSFTSFYQDKVNIDNSSTNNNLILNIQDLIPFLTSKGVHGNTKKILLTEVSKFITNQNQYDIIFNYSRESIKAEFEYLLNHNTKNVIFQQSYLRQGFILDNQLIISENDFFPPKKQTQKKKTYTKKVDIFADLLMNLKEGDYIIHGTFGIGKYLGLDVLEFNGKKNDYLIIEYAQNDKVYLPIYKLDQVQKYQDGSNKVSLDNLNSNKFEKAKSRARESVKKLAFDLIQLQAQRQAKSSHIYNPPMELFREFEHSFPYQETEDQIKAIEDCLNDMKKSVPMDRLICGDVGFGKTEIAMRAAYFAVLDKKQVAILVPTTILTFQHYHSFKKRFEGFPVNIEYFSRTKSTKETKEIIANLKDHKIDIIIGTHKLLAKNIEFSDLGLLIIDEEQRFGVAHKEKLKLFKTSIDVLTLTATPIPRTLQLSYMGIRDLSLIQTPPPRRQSIKTYLIHEDEKTIKKAIEREISRGGQVFFVHNRVSDIELVAYQLHQLVPYAKIVIGHGQLKEKDLEERMKDFYEGKFNILVATTIIESGIDIPSANTLIVNNAHMFGLSQLHQLRGRIGRSNLLAYSYFVLPRDKAISEVASKRLQALQRYSEIGAGFALANSDLDIRGGGDILGGEQSGHIENVGLELYLKLLKSAIAEIKDEESKYNTQQDIDITTPFLSILPNHYISHQGERLKYYKKLSNSNNFKELDDIMMEIEDIFGKLPEEAGNLYWMIKIKILLSSIGIIRVNITETNMKMKFSKEFLDHHQNIRDNVVTTFMKRPKIFKIFPDFSINCQFSKAWTKDSLYEFIEDIVRQISSC